MKRWGAMLLILLAPAIHAQQPPSGGMVEIPLLGLRVVPQPGDAYYGGTVSRIVAVRQGGPAFRAGLQPGDEILEFDFGDGKDIHGAPDLLKNAVATRARPGVPMMVHYQYVFSGEAPVSRRAPVSGAGGLNRSANFEHVTPQAPGDGPWIETQIQHTYAGTVTRPRAQLPGVDDALAGSQKRFDELYDARVKVIMADPCGMIEKAEKLGDELTALAKANNLPDKDYGFILTRTSQTECANKRYGPLPDFEATVVAMHWKEIDPCKYDPAANYSAQLAAARGRIAANAYPTVAISATYAQNPCFEEFVIARLTGRPFKPHP
jgi:hypothetical protein